MSDDWMDKFKAALASDIPPQDYSQLSAKQIAEIEEDLISVEDLDPEDAVGKFKGFNFYIWLDEAAEPILGTQKFKILKSRFAVMRGVTGCVQEDREVFYIKATGHTCESLDKAMRAEWTKLKGE